MTGHPLPPQVWHPPLGTVRLELQFDDGRVREFSVSPIHAALILKFQDREVCPNRRTSHILRCRTSRSPSIGIPPAAGPVAAPQ
eukprot:1183838-Prorocentrum_minimum.AAC.5